MPRLPGKKNPLFTVQPMRFLSVGSIVIVRSLMFRSLPHFLKSGGSSYILTKRIVQNKRIERESILSLFSLGKNGMRKNTIPCPKLI